MTQRNKENIKKDFIALALMGAGIFSMLGAAGTEDEREARDAKNIYIGEEVYDDKDLASKTTTGLMMLGGTAAFGAGALMLKQKER